VPSSAQRGLCERPRHGMRRPDGGGDKERRRTEEAPSHFPDRARNDARRSGGSTEIATQASCRCELPRTAPKLLEDRPPGSSLTDPFNAGGASSTNTKQRQRQGGSTCATEVGRVKGAYRLGSVRSRDGEHRCSGHRREPSRGAAVQRIELGRDCGACIPAIAHFDRIEGSAKNHRSSVALRVRRTEPNIVASI